MKVVCARKDLLEGVKVANRAIGKGSALPILEHILIQDIDEDKLKIVATDLEISIECVVEADIVEPGQMVIPAKVLGNILGALPDNDVSLCFDINSKADLACGAAKYSILGLPSEEFPIMPKTENQSAFTTTFVVNSNVLSNAISKIAFGISQDETRATMTGALLQINGDDARLVSTDGHRLCTHELNINNSNVEINETVDVIIPGRALKELLHILPAGRNAINVSIESNQIIFEIADNMTVLTSRLIDGQFPNYHRILPRTYDKKIIVSAEQLYQCVKRVDFIACENSHEAIFDMQGDVMTITAESGNIGQAHEECLIVKDGADIAINFNADYLLDVLNVIDTDAVEIELANSASVAIFKQQRRSDYIYALMPITKRQDSKNAQSSTEADNDIQTIS